MRQIAQKKGGGKKKVSLRPSPSTVIILGVHRGLSMIIGRAENKKSTFFVGRFVILDFAGKVDLSQSQVGV